MRTATAVVRDWRVSSVEGESGLMNGASLVKPVVAQAALEIIDDLDEPVLGDITVRHVLTHTTGLPNWRPGKSLEPLRSPGVQWGYSGEGFVLLQRYLERRTGQSLDDLVDAHVFAPLGMGDSRLDDPEPGYHGYRPLLTTARDYGVFLAHTLSIGDGRWDARWSIDQELAWAAGWGIEVGPPAYVWQWGLNDAASNFVIGCPATGSGVVVLTDDPQGRTFYRGVVERELPGDHASLRVEQNATWLALVT